MDAMNAIVLEFVEEGNEKADQIERHLIQLEKNPRSREPLAEIFRALHTIKGASSFLEFRKLCALAHSGESVIVRLRDGALVANPEIISVLLSVVDSIREALSGIAATGHEGSENHADLISRLARFQQAA
jgi:two-component system, chemotaxis family, sensor kinase CheA